MRQEQAKFDSLDDFVFPTESGKQQDRNNARNQRFTGILTMGAAGFEPATSRV